MRARISQRALEMPESGIRRIFELVASVKDPINLSIGQAHFDVPDAIAEVACDAIKSGFNRYTVTQGLPALNDAVLRRSADLYGYDGEHSLITSGVSGGLLLGFMSLLDPGDEVLVPDPYFTMYAVLAGMCGATWSTYPHYPGTPLTEELLEASISERTRVLLVNTPSNPTGRTLTDAELRAVGAVARRHDLFVVSDEIYDAFVYDGPHVSAAGRVDTDRLLLLGGFSKTYGMPGWRLGWALGPDDLIDAMRRFQQFTFVCAPAPFQKAALAALDVDMSKEIAQYRGKRDRILDGIADHYEVSKPGGSFYMWPKLPDGIGSDEYMEAALARRLLVVPGKAFSAHDTHLRLSFAAEDDVLDRGVEALNALADEFDG